MQTYFHSSLGVYQATPPCNETYCKDCSVPSDRFILKSQSMCHMACHVPPLPSLFSLDLTGLLPEFPQKSH
jgi:hypothetical protein